MQVLTLPFQFRVQYMIFQKQKKKKERN